METKSKSEMELNLETEKEVEIKREYEDVSELAKGVKIDGVKYKSGNTVYFFILTLKNGEKCSIKVDNDFISLLKTLKRNNGKDIVGRKLLRVTQENKMPYYWLQFTLSNGEVRNFTPKWDFRSVIESEYNILKQKQINKKGE